MLNTKLNLYNAEWLDIVFANKNKSYGAYDLRQHYAGNMVRAMLITFTFIAAGGVYLKLNGKDIPVERGIIVTIPDLVHPPIAPAKKPDEPKPRKAETQRAVALKQHLMPKPTDSPAAVDPPKNIDLTGQTGPVTRQGESGAPVDLIEDKPVGPASAPAPTGNEIVNTFGLEVQPEPFGGMEAFSKFLGRTLRFPAAASDAGVSGRVVVSFVIEKDGNLSNIVVEKGAGYGFDQEAVRVLKLAKAWKPGRQNGQAVRVRYMVPINFQLPE